MIIDGSLELENIMNIESDLLVDHNRGLIIDKGVGSEFMESLRVYSEKEIPISLRSSWQIIHPSIDPGIPVWAMVAIATFVINALWMIPVYGGRY